MKVLAFIICTLFSTSLFAASYATCSANVYNNKKQISLKLTWNKVFLNENNKGLEEWKKQKYTNEEIVITKTTREAYKCDIYCWELSKQQFKKRVKLINEMLNKAPFTKKYTITVDRISGSLTEVRESYLVNGNALEKYTKEYKYTCEASDKTKF